jgi:Lsr2 protein
VGREKTQTIREWARANGYNPSARGRISQDMKQAYETLYFRRIHDRLARTRQQDNAVEVFRAPAEVVVSLPPMIAACWFDPGREAMVALEEAAVAVASLDVTAGTRMAAISGFLLRSEAVSSSKIEHVGDWVDQSPRAWGTRSHIPVRLVIGVVFVACGEDVQHGPAGDGNRSCGLPGAGGPFLIGRCFPVRQDRPFLSAFSQQRFSEGRRDRHFVRCRSV